jgi:glycyl-tRNA synthetase beta chain
VVEAAVAASGAGLGLADERSSEYLLEVRAEEIPARMLPGASRELATRVFEELMGRGIGPAEVETGYTPRRLLLVLKGLPKSEPDRDEEVLGPPLQAALPKGANAEGGFTEAAQGFAKRCSRTLEELLVVETKDKKIFRSVMRLGEWAGAAAKPEVKGLYLADVRRVRGRATAAVLAEIVPRVLAALSWQKTMKWGNGTGPWVRPIHGIVSLFDGVPVAFELLGVTAAAATIGHPILSPEPFSVRGAADYRARLAERGLEASAESRRATLAERMQARASALGGTLVEDEELLGKLAAICEIPGVMEGALSPEVMALPREVLTTSLRDHQSAFTVEKNGALLPVFFTVMDRPDDPAGHVRGGNEWVVRARLADARFFYGEDRKTSLAARAERLSHLVFHERLGTYAEKTSRLVELSEWICRALHRGEDVGPAKEAAGLLKADLTTEMVKEFTSLQGVMGGIYSREDGHGEPVWQAIYDQYLPAGTADRVPRGTVGPVVALADRLDTLVGMFGLGLVPTGSKDPFGLRRAAQGIVRVALERSLALDLAQAAEAAARFYGGRLQRDAAQIVGDLRPFLFDRLRYVLGLRGFAYDEIEAALAKGSLELPDLEARVDAIHRVRGEDQFVSIVQAAKRIENILRDQEPQSLDAKRLRLDAEVELYRELEALRGEVEAAAAAREYERSLRRVNELAGALDRFFVDVMVMDEDLAVRANRVALLQEIQAVLGRVGKLTEIVVEKRKA